VHSGQQQKTVIVEYQVQIAWRWGLDQPMKRSRPASNQAGFTKAQATQQSVAVEDKVA
jgi:hypothetical protein